MNGISISEKFKPAYILLGINIAVYIYITLIGGNFLNTNPEMIDRYGQVHGLVIYGGLFTGLGIGYVLGVRRSKNTNYFIVHSY